jgi:hypothetical protein
VRHGPTSHLPLHDNNKRTNDTIEIPVTEILGRIFLLHDNDDDDDNDTIEIPVTEILGRIFITEAGIGDFFGRCITILFILWSEEGTPFACCVFLILLYFFACCVSLILLYFICDNVLAVRSPAPVRRAVRKTASALRG